MSTDTKASVEVKQPEKAGADTPSPSASQQRLSLQQIATMIDDLRATELQTRINAFKNLSVIAKALGPERTREELIPYINEFTEDEDEVLIVLAEGLGALLPEVGGPAHGHVLLVPAEALCAVEESSVRDRAIGTIQTVTAAMDNDDVMKHIIPLIRRLANGDWFTSRMAACSMFVFVYPRVSSNVALKKELRAMFVKLCGDETPMVRRAACSNLGKLAPVVEYQFVKSDLFPPLVSLTKDEQDSVRLLTVDAAIAMAKVFQRQDNLNQMLPVVFTVLGDKSWRVRYMIADKFCDVLRALEEYESKIEELVDGFVSLLNDVEAEVRTAASFKVAEVAKLVGPQRTLRKLLPPIRALCKDSSQYARAALASVITDIAPICGKRDVFDHLLPLYLILLKDSNPDVRLNIISKLDVLSQVMGVELLTQSLMPAIGDLASDKKWRVRLSIINHIPDLARQLGTQFFESNLSELCMGWLGDPVYSIREAGTANLTKLAEVFGTAWAKNHIIPKVANLAAHKSYLFRLTSLYAARDLARVLGPELTSSKLVPVVMGLATDPVANVRFNVCKTIQAMLPHITPQVVNNDIIPMLRNMSSGPSADSDVDVRFYAASALEEATNPKPPGAGPPPFVNSAVAR